MNTEITEVIQLIPTRMNTASETLRHEIKTCITYDLTIGRSDNDLEPLTGEQIKKYIEGNTSSIDRIVEAILEDYRKDEEIELEISEDFDQFELVEWVREYLYSEESDLAYLQNNLEHAEIEKYIF